MGFHRPPNSPDWIGSFKDSASEKILPRLISRPASITSCGVTLFSVPIWSSLPQRPQFDSFFAASSIAARSTFIGIPSFQVVYVQPSLRGALVTKQSREPQEELDCFVAT